MVWLMLVALGAGPVEEARAHLAAGKLDEVLFALDGQRLEGAERAEAAQLLARAGAQAWRGGDALLALQFAQMALKHDGAVPMALEVAGRAAMAQQQFAAAEGYVDRWIVAEPRSGAARVLRAELAAEAGEWQIVLDQLDQVKLTGDEEAIAQRLKGRATAELSARKAALTEVAALERQLMQAAARAKSSAGGARPRGAASGVTVYTTSWCGYCKKAKAYLKKKGISFVERDIERDAGAAEELAEKAVAAGMRPGGVPVIDVRGRLILGFNQAALDEAL